MPSGRAGSLRRLVIPLAIGLGVAGLALLGWLLWAKFQGKADAPPKPPKISLIPVAPPPPPPPPPKEEKRPEPPKEQQEMKAPQPVEQKAPAPAQSPDLKMEGAAGDGPSAFSAGRVTNENQIPATKGGGGSSPAAVEIKPERPIDPPKLEPKIEPPKPRNPLEKSALFNPLANYSRVLKIEAQKHFNQNRALRQRPYRVEVLLWIAEDGRPTRAELVAGSGDDETDSLLREALGTLPRFSEAPPTEIQLPIRLAITTSGRN